MLRQTIFLYGIGLISGLALPAAALAWSVDATEGPVTVETGPGASQDVQSGRELNKGESVVVGTGGRVSIVEAGSTIGIGENSRLKVEELPHTAAKKRGLLNLLQGKIRAKIQHQDRGVEYPYEFKTRSAVAGVRGTEFLLLNEGNEARVLTLDGMVRVHSANDPAKGWDVAKGQALTAPEGKEPIVKAANPDEVKKLIDQTERPKKESSKDARAKKTEAHDKSHKRERRH